MSRFFTISLFCSLLFIAFAGLGSAQDDDEKIACYAFPKSTQSYKEKLWDGYEISLGPARNASGEGDDYTAAIYNAAGRVVFRTTGFGVIFDEEHTGLDFDGDGKGEVVFETDQAGGAHCCWVYNVVTLSPRPRKLFDVGDGAAVDFVKEKDGRVTIWDRVGGAYDYTSSAQRPYAERALRFESGKLTDVTPEFCDKLLSPANPDYEYWSRVLTPVNIAKLQSAAKIGANADPDVQGTASALLARAEQSVLCHRYDEALDDLNLWPEATRDEMKDQFARSVEDYDPEFVNWLKRQPGPSK